ncbi:hypothetical protein [Devosia psychrophila]|jgi:hypothetical protein|uniref:hypothetical protein n=1 Tax=Devosia psychrophila TaxID=728005 RepID=UPI001160D0E6|nr:hypothetical protein [Devosia psychrophila]
MISSFCLLPLRELPRRLLPVCGSTLASSRVIAQTGNSSPCSKDSILTADLVQGDKYRFDDSQHGATSRTQQSPKKSALPAF